MQSDRDVADLRDIHLSMAALGAQMSRLRAKADRIKSAAVRPGEAQVADHAIVRYLERVEGVDIEALKQRVRAYAQQCQPTNVRGIFQHDSGHQVVTNRAGLIVTILPPGQTVGHESKDFQEE